MPAQSYHSIQARRDCCIGKDLHWLEWGKYIWGNLHTVGSQDTGADQNTDPELGGRRFSLSKHTRVELKAFDASSNVYEGGDAANFGDTVLQERGNLTDFTHSEQSPAKRIIGPCYADLPFFFTRKVTDQTQKKTDQMQAWKLIRVLKSAPYGYRLSAMVASVLSPISSS